MQLTIRRDGLLTNLFIAILIASSIVPFVSRNISIYLSTYALLFMLLVLVARITLARQAESLMYYAVMLMPFLAWKMLTYFTTSESIVIWGYQILADLSNIMIGFYITRNRRYALRHFALLIIVAFLLTMVTTLLGASRYPEAARWLATVAYSKDPRMILYDMANIGGYAFVYSAVLLYPVLILAYKQKKISLLPTLSISILLLFLLLYVQYTMALLLFIVSSVFFLFRRDLSRRGLIMIIIISIIFLLFFNDLISDALYALSKLVQSETMSTRLNYLAGDRSMDEEIAGGTRLTLYLMSIRTFLSNPLLGTFLNGGRGSGGHSFILDFLAQYGMLGVTLLILMYRRIYHLFFMPFQNRRGYGYVLWILFQAIILSTVNTGMWLGILTLLAPILLHVVYTGRGGNEDLVGG